VLGWLHWVLYAERDGCCSRRLGYFLPHRGALNETEAWRTGSVTPFLGYFADALRHTCAGSTCLPQLLHPTTVALPRKSGAQREGERWRNRREDEGALSWSWMSSSHLRPDRRVEPPPRQGGARSGAEQGEDREGGASSSRPRRSSAAPSPASPERGEREEEAGRRSRSPAASGVLHYHHAPPPFPSGQWPPPRRARGQGFAEERERPMAEQLPVGIWPLHACPWRSSRRSEGGRLLSIHGCAGREEMRARPDLVYCTAVSLQGVEIDACWHILAYLGLSWLISSHRILFILPAEHYSFYQPNTLNICFLLAIKPPPAGCCWSLLEESRSRKPMGAGVCAEERAFGVVARRRPGQQRRLWCAPPPSVRRNVFVAGEMLPLP
jgi:hypothetical protein